MEPTFDLRPGEERLFVDESLEQIERIEAGLLLMERGVADAAVLNEVFRAAHTLKGSAGAIGHARLGGLTHAMEDVLGAIRSGAVRDPAGLAGPLLASTDVLRDLLAEVTTGRRLVDPADLTADLRARLAAATTGASPAPATADPGSGAGAGAAADPLVARLLADAPASGGARSIVRLVVDEACEWAGVRLYQAVVEADGSGILLASVPSREEIEGGLSDRHLTLLVRGDPESLVHLGERLAAIDELGVEAVVPLETELAAEAAGTGSGTDAGLSAVLGPVPAAAPERRLADLGPEARGIAGEERTAIAGDRLKLAQQTIRIDVSRLDELMNLVGELVTEKTRLVEQAARLRDRLGDDPLAREADEGAQQFGRTAGRLQDEVTGLRMLPVGTVFGRFPRVVRDVAAKLGKEVALVIEGQDTELDRSVLEEIGDPLGHLIRNSLDHGIEPPSERIEAGKPAEGRLRLGARHGDGQIVITVEDDGRGLDAAALRRRAVERGLLEAGAAAALSDEEALAIVFLPGFSTAVRVTDVSGRGVGMDVVRTNIERIGGRVEIRSTPGLGTLVTLSLPLTLAIVGALLVRSGGRVCCLPLAGVVETLRVAEGAISTVLGSPVITLRERVLRVVQLDAALGDPGHALAAPGHDHVSLVVLRHRGRELAIAVDELIGRQEIVLKSLSTLVGRPAGIAGGTILSDGTVGLVIDIGAVLERAAGSGRAA